MDFFRNKRILITGASKGIGFALAKKLDSFASNLILHTSSTEGINKLETHFGSKNHLLWKADFLYPDRFETSLPHILDNFGPIDGFVNCVGVRLRRPINLLNVKIVQDVISANFISYIELIRIITKKNRFNPGLSILNISSIAAHSGSASVSIYAASKAAAESANRCLAKELAKKKIRVNAIVCGQIETESYKELINLKEDSLDPVLDRQYMGLGRVDDIANIITFMLSEQSDFITGQLIPADGGFLT